MAGNDDFSNDQGNNSLDLFRGIVSLAPVALGGYYSYQSLASHRQNVLPPSDPTSSNFIQGVMRAAGSKINKSIKRSTKDRLERDSNLVKKFTDPKFLNEIWNAVGAQNALMQSLVSTIRDPELALNDEQTRLMKEQIERVFDRMANSTDNAIPEDLREAVGKMVASVVESADGRARFDKYLNQYRDIGNQLTPSKWDLDTFGTQIKPWAGKADQLSFGARNRIDRLKDMIGNDFEMIQKDKGIYARIKGRRGAIDLAIEAESRGVTKVFNFGEKGETNYIAPKHVGRANRFIENKREFDSPLPSKYSSRWDQYRDYGAIVDPEDYVMDVFETHYKKSHNIDYVDVSRLGRDMKLIMATDFRGAASMAGASKPNEGHIRQFGQHLIKSGNLNMAYMPIVGGEKFSDRDMDTLHKRLIHDTEYFDTGVPSSRIHVRNEETGQVVMNIGLRANAPVSMLRSYQRVNPANPTLHRAMLDPITARPEQITGRPGAFINRATDRVTRDLPGSNRKSIGAADAVDWQGLTGTTTRFVMYDLDNETGLADMGQAYTAGRFRVANHQVKPIISRNTGGANSQLMDFIISQHKAGNRATITEAELQKYGTFLGIDASGNKQHFRMSPGMKASYATVESYVDAFGKEILRPVFHNERVVDTGAKLFSRPFKGTTHRRPVKEMRGMVGSLGMGHMVGPKGNVRDDMLIVTTTDTVTKSAMSMMEAMVSGLEYITGKSADSVYTLDTSTVGEIGGKGNFAYGNMLERGIAFAKTHGIENEQDFFHVLALQYKAGHKVSGLSKEEHRAAMSRMLTKHFGQGAGALVQRLDAAKGAFSIAQMAAGPMPGEYGSSLASIEPRTLTMLANRLNAMGMDKDKVSSFIANFMERRVGGTGTFEHFDKWRNLASSAIGNEPLALPQKAGRVMTLADLQEFKVKYGSNGKDATWVKHLLAEGDVRLDLSDSSVTPGSTPLRAATRNVFNADQMYLPGGQDFLETMKGTSIKTSSGDKVIANEYLREVDHILSGILNVSTSALNSERLAEPLMRDANKKLLTLANDAIHGVMRGKIKGSQFVTGSAYLLGNPSKDRAVMMLTASQEARVAGLMRSTSNAVSFMDSTAFLNVMREAKEGIGSEDVASQMIDFFTGGEIKASKRYAPKGVKVVAQRHPNLSMGHMNVLDVHRDVREVGMRGSDPVLKKFLATKAGSEAQAELMAALGWDKQGGKHFDFQSIGYAYQKNKNVIRAAKNEKAKEEAKKAIQAIRGFFGTMTGTIDKWHVTEGGGIFYIPQAHIKAKIGGKEKSYNMSISNAMIGDFDGDTYGIFALPKQLIRNVTGALKQDGDVYRNIDAEYRLASEIFAGEAKETIARRAKIATERDPNSATFWEDFTKEASETLEQNVMKEKGVKAVGPLDVQMNVARTLVSGYGGDRKMNAKALALLKIMEEVAVIKGKKLPTFEDWGARLQSAMKQTIRGTAPSVGQTPQDALKHLLFNEFFEGSDLLGPGIKVEGIEAEGSLRGLGERYNEMLAGSKYDIQSVLNHIVDSISKARASGWTGDAFETAEKSLRALQGNNRDLQNAFLYEGESMATALLSGDMNIIEDVAARASKTVRSIGNLTDNLDRHSMMPIAAGLFASAVIGGLLGTPSYDSNVMAMPGESTGGAVGDAVESGTALGSSVTHPTPGSLVGDLSNRVLNQRSTYLQPQGNAYQIRGSTNSSYGMGNVANYFSGLTRGGGSGHININDSRRPLTPNYLDRMMGE